MASENDTNAQNGAASGQIPSTKGEFALKLLADAASCIRFFSRIPVSQVNRLDEPAALPDFTTQARAAPLAGAFVALPAAALGLALGYTAFPPLGIALLVVALLAIVTGALHEDGLADIADGFFGGHTPERRLDIMKDSRIGAFGTIALVLALGLKAVLIAELIIRFGPAVAMVTLLGLEAFSRALIVWQWNQLPPARPTGLAARFGTPNRTSVLIAFALAVLCMLPALIKLPPLALITGCGFGILSAQGIAQLARAKIGGATGDVLGAIQQIGVLACLFGMLILPLA
ncbi:adenosylcobinamide-GDP ribazoletransferase [Roseibium sediminis]|uniref:adenosylcobinamide-GDP ribazoletransferase n=1 Tax=Roseibium sediminis TaxID=1775174 RepID=UPI00123D2D6C|nr:adenosylcobinamide-GDP ribazoletransferase [Roseibium sediminis]